MIEAPLTLSVPKLLNFQAVAEDHTAFHEKAFVMPLIHNFLIGRMDRFHKLLGEPLCNDHSHQDLLSLREKINKDFGEILSFGRPWAAHREDAKRFFWIISTPVHGKQKTFYLILSIGADSRIHGIWIRPA